MNCTQLAIFYLEESIGDTISSLEYQAENIPQCVDIIDGTIKALGGFIKDLATLKPFEDKDFEELTEEAINLSFKYAAKYSEEDE